MLGVDIDPEAIEYAKIHYEHRQATFIAADALQFDVPQCDAVVCFETIEHIEDPRPLLRKFAETSPTMLASVPNEDVFPFQNHKFHFRHYTAAEFNQLLNECGWEVVEWYGQQDDQSDVRRRWMGRTIIAQCKRKVAEPARSTVVEVESASDVAHSISVAEAIHVDANCSVEGGSVDSTASWGRPFEPIQTEKMPEVQSAPAHVAILGLGPSLHTYMDYCRRAGSRHKVADETWAINALGDTFICDRVFHMDDVRIQQIRAEARPDSNIAAMLTWLKKHPGPIYTSRKHPDYPGLVDFPLEAVARKLGHLYFNNTAAYAVAYAIFIGVKKITVFGCDYTYPNAHDAEKGRGCLEFWLGQACARGIKIAMPKTTSLMDACYGDIQRIYGYDTLEIKRSIDEGKLRLEFLERPVLPTADEIEERYDHSVHPNPLVK